MTSGISGLSSLVPHCCPSAHASLLQPVWRAAVRFARRCEFRYLHLSSPFPRECITWNASCRRAYFVLYFPPTFCSSSPPKLSSFSILFPRGGSELYICDRLPDRGLGPICGGISHFGLPFCCRHFPSEADLDHGAFTRLRIRIGYESTLDTNGIGHKIGSDTDTTRIGYGTGHGISDNASLPKAHVILSLHDAHFLSGWEGHK